MYCKKCFCGYINIYNVEGAAPLECESCGRMMLEVTEELYVHSILNEPKKEETNMYLCYENESIAVSGKILVGRNNVCKEWLLYYHDVSREHFYIEPRTSGIGATITDVSSFGTYLNGNRIRKNSPQFITSGTEIRLASSATMKFVIKGE